MSELTVEELQEQLATLTTERDNAQTEAAAARESMAASVTALRDSLVAANPTIPATAIAGDSPDELAASVERAAAFRDEVLKADREAAKANGHKSTVPIPAGSTSTDVSGFSDEMSPFQRIRAAMAAN